MKNTIKVFFLFLITTLLFSYCSEKKNRKLEIEQDILKYRDSLKVFFSDLEINLIEQQLKNYEEIESEEDFYSFFKRHNTLKDVLNKRLEKASFEIRKTGVKQLPPCDWFHDLVNNMQVIRVYNNLMYKIILDYEKLYEKTLGTKGIKDNEFIGLLKICFDNKSHFPNWNKYLENNNICSLLGSSIHKSILEYIHEELNENELFKKEILTIQYDLLQDVLQAESYCQPRDRVIQEIEDISIFFNEPDIKTRLKEKIEKLKTEI